MTQQLVGFLQEFEDFSMMISILLTIIISILGVVPLLFLTVANVLVFGFLKGAIVNIIGEVLGAIIAFYLYRKGLKKFVSKKMESNEKVKKILETEGKEAFLLLLTFRLIPFMSSTIVTVAASLSKTSMAVFALSTLLGKIPALLIECYSIEAVSSLHTEIRFAIGIVIFILLLIYFKIQKNKTTN